MMQRFVEEEWLDFDQGTTAEIDAALRSVEHVNRRYGGVRLHARLLRRALRDVSGRPHILEVASGRGYVLEQALALASVDAEVTLLDRSEKHLPQQETWPGLSTELRLVCGDALALPLPDKSVDVVTCCLFLHHLEPRQVMRLFAEATRIARVAFVVNDLERTRPHLWLARLHALRDPSRISTHDGPVSVRRAYTRRELGRMLANTGLRYELERAFLYRMGAILWCQ